MRMPRLHGAVQDWDGAGAESRWLAGPRGLARPASHGCLLPGPPGATAVAIRAQACILGDAAPRRPTSRFELNITHPNHLRAPDRQHGAEVTLHGTPLSKEPAIGFTHLSSKAALSLSSNRHAMRSETLLAFGARFPSGIGPAPLLLGTKAVQLHCASAGGNACGGGLRVAACRACQCFSSFRYRITSAVGRTPKSYAHNP